MLIIRYVPGDAVDQWLKASFSLQSYYFGKFVKDNMEKENLDKEKLWFPQEDLNSKLVTMSQLDALSTELQTTCLRPWAGSGQHELRRSRVFLPSWFCVICTPSKRVIILIWLKKAEKRLPGRISRMVIIHELGAYIRYISNERPAYWFITFSFLLSFLWPVYPCISGHRSWNGSAPSL